MKRPNPVITDDALAYWQGCNDHKLLLQRCRDCDVAQFPHRVVCTSCGSRQVEVEEASGAGTIYSSTVVMRAPAPEFQPEIPYTVAHVDLDEGPRMMTNILGDPKDVEVGMRVVVEWDDDNEQTFPVFRTVAEG